MSKGKKVAQRIRKFRQGWNGEFPTLEEVLLKDGKLIDIGDEPKTTATEVIEDTSLLMLNYTDSDGSQQSCLLNPCFKEFMETHGEEVHYITKAGTPWLTREHKKEEPELNNEYKLTLRTGRNNHLAIMGWKPFRKVMSPGHAWVNFGAVEQGESGVKITANDKNYSFYSCAPYHPMAKHSKEARKETIDALAEEHPGMIAGARASSDPTYQGAAIGALVTSIVAYFVAKNFSERNEGGKRPKKLLRRAIPVAAAAVLGGAGGAGGGYLAEIWNYTPAVLVNQEEHGSGALAVLITPAQRDILQTSLEGLIKTIAGKYSIRMHNCGDFANEMFEEIGVEVKQLIDEHLQQSQYKDKFVHKKLGADYPHRPDTRGRALEGLRDRMAQLQHGEETIHASIMNVAGHVAVLAHSPYEPETPHPERALFDDDNVMDTIRKVLSAMRLEDTEHGTHFLNFHEHISTVDITPENSLVRG